MLKIFSLMQLGPDDVFLDIGCGYGVSCLIAVLIFKCKAAHGVEIDLDVVRGAKELASRFHCPISFTCCDLMQLQHWPCATAVYLYDEAFLPHMITKIKSSIVPRFKKLRAFSATKSTSELPIFKTVRVYPQGSMSDGRNQRVYLSMGRTDNFFLVDAHVRGWHAQPGKPSCHFC